MKLPVYEMSCPVYGKSYICQISYFWNVMSMKCPLSNQHYAYEISIYEMCCLWNVLSMKCVVYEMSFYEMNMTPRFYLLNISRFRLVLLNISRFRLDLLNISRFRLCLLKMIQVQIRPALNGKCYNWRYGGFSFELLPFECSFELLFIWIILTWRHIL